MSSFIKTLSRKLTEHFGSVFNVGIICLTYFESYLFPLGIYKLLVLITKYRSVIARLRKVEESNNVLKSRLSYRLELLTIENIVLPDYRRVEHISHVSILIEEEEIQVRLPPFSREIQYCDCTIGTTTTLVYYVLRLYSIGLESSRLNERLFVV